ncbi:GNAT family N-acetyltransferase [Halosimplex litoreum]|uniref:GNAT family N-acetyltransferase n=1 Tax=Halosimplex litoreum TaxID=1198301 RepID=A0A7T3KU84_9EURY|nr:GNAT family N-acetyltransferase [Halosimplex litoreum]QPV61809.1 GNAT family N-acetyltransferase [Halosimplex litoreum]
MGSNADSDAAAGRLRRYEPRDRDVVWDLHRTALRAAGSNPEDVPDNDDIRDIEANYLDPGGEFLVVESDGEVVAIGGLAVEDEGIPDDAGELLRIAVDPDHQRTGHGDRVVAGLEDAARERGLDRVFLWTAQRQRSAVRFYRARGYEGTDHRTEGEYELIRFEKALGSSD